MASEQIEAVDDMVAALKQSKRRRNWRVLLGLVGAAAGLLLVWAVIGPSPCDQLAAAPCESAGVDVALCEPYVELLHALDPSQDACEAALAVANQSTGEHRTKALHRSLRDIVSDALVAHGEDPLDEELELVAKKIGARRR